MKTIAELLSGLQSPTLLSASAEDCRQRVLKGIEFLSKQDSQWHSKFERPVDVDSNTRNPLAQLFDRSYARATVEFNLTVYEEEELGFLNDSRHNEEGRTNFLNLLWQEAVQFLNAGQPA